MQKIKGLGHLIEDVLAMAFCENVFSNKGVKVDVHMLEDEIDIPVIICPDDFFEFDNVGMVEFHEKHDLSVCSLSICGIVKSVKVFLECFCLVSTLIGDLPHMAIGSAAYFLQDLEPGEDMSFNLLAH